MAEIRKFWLISSLLLLVFSGAVFGEDVTFRVSSAPEHGKISSFFSEDSVEVTLPESAFVGQYAPIKEFQTYWGAFAATAAGKLWLYAVIKWTNRIEEIHGAIPARFVFMSLTNRRGVATLPERRLTFYDRIIGYSLPYPVLDFVCVNEEIKQTFRAYLKTGESSLEAGLISDRDIPGSTLTPISSKAVSISVSTGALQMVVDNFRIVSELLEFESVSSVIRWAAIGNGIDFKLGRVTSPSGGGQHFWFKPTGRMSAKPVKATLQSADPQYSNKCALLLSTKGVGLGRLARAVGSEQWGYSINVDGTWAAGGFRLSPPLVEEIRSEAKQVTQFYEHIF